MGRIIFGELSGVCFSGFVDGPADFGEAGRTDFGEAGRTDFGEAGRIDFGDASLSGGDDLGDAGDCRSLAPENIPEIISDPFSSFSDKRFR